MKKRFGLLLCALLCGWGSLHADEFDDAPLEGQFMRHEGEGADDLPDTPPCFWELNFMGNAISKSHFSTTGYRNQEISYHEDFTTLSYNHFFCRDLALSLGCTYGDVGINWNQNPAFNRRHFESIAVNLGAYHQTQYNWLWRASFSARFSLKDNQVPGYVQYTQALWGRYANSPCFGTHVGYAFETGLRKDTIWPIIGFDYRWSDWINIYVVYPFEAHIHFDFCHPWALELSTRRFRYRDRCSKNEPVPQALFEYDNSGAELRLLYEWAPVLNADLHVGYAFGGDLRIGNRKNKHSPHYKFDSAPYIGGSFIFRY